MNTKLLIIAGLILSITRLAHAESDQAIKAFFGLRSCEVKVAPLRDPNSHKEIWYVAALAKFENGKFLGYGRIEGGVRGIFKTAEEDGKLELMWGKKDGKMGYVMTWPMGAEDFKEDSFFDGITYCSTGGETGIPIIEKYEGFEIEDFAAVPPAEGIMKPHNPPISPMEGNFMSNIARFPKVALLLYREFPSQKEYWAWIQSHKGMDDVPKKQ